MMIRAAARLGNFWSRSATPPGRQPERENIVEGGRGLRGHREMFNKTQGYWLHRLRVTMAPGCVCFTMPPRRKTGYRTLQEGEVGEFEIVAGNSRGPPRRRRAKTERLNSARPLFTDRKDESRFAGHFVCPP